MAHFRRQWVNDLDGLERDFSNLVAGLQKACKAAIRGETAPTTSAVEPFMLPSKRLRAFADCIHQSNCLR
jgi:hypothetical protein